jgi:hypothetical protein
MLLNVAQNLGGHLFLWLVGGLVGADNERLGNFTRTVIVDRDDSAVSNSSVAKEVAFELGRGNLVAL